MKKSSRGIGHCPIHFVGGTGTVAAGATAYIQAAVCGTGGMQATETLNCFHVVTKAGIISNLAVKALVPPGAGETFTYTLRVNAADTTLTCQIGGAADNRAQDLVNQVVIAIGDVLTLKVVNSAGGASTSHSGSVEHSC